MLRNFLVFIGYARPKWNVNFAKIPRPFIVKRAQTKPCTCGERLKEGELGIIHNHKHTGWERSGRPKYQASYIRHPECHMQWLRDNDWHPQAKSLEPTSSTIKWKNIPVLA